jgi:hypothetical protein
MRNQASGGPTGSSLAFIRGWAVDRGDLLFVEAQIHGELPAVMSHVVEHAVSNRHLAWLLTHQLARSQHPPFGVQQAIVRGLL